MVRFILKKEFFEKILLGEKIEEYRAVNTRNALILFDCKKIGKDEVEIIKPKNIKEIRFELGYTGTYFIIEVKKIAYEVFENFIPEDFVKGSTAFTIYLGKILKIHKKWLYLFFSTNLTFRIMAGEYETIRTMTGGTVRGLPNRR